MFKLFAKVLALTALIAAVAYSFMGPFAALINAPYTFAVFGAIMLAVVTVLVGGWLVWALLNSIINQATKEST